VSPGATIKLRLGTGWLSLNSETTSLLAVAKLAQTGKNAMFGCSIHSLSCQPWSASPPFLRK